MSGKQEKRKRSTKVISIAARREQKQWQRDAARDLARRLTEETFAMMEAQYRRRRLIKFAAIVGIAFAVSTVLALLVTA